MKTSGQVGGADGDPFVDREADHHPLWDSVDTARAYPRTFRVPGGLGR
jgi:hypothetical protein